MRRWQLILTGMATAVCAAAASMPPGFNRSAPESWDLWRCGSFPFPDRIVPQVPEAVPGAAIEFGAKGEELAIIEPDAMADDRDGRALQAMVRLIVEKVPKAAVVRAGQVTPALQQKHLLVVGTLSDNAFAAAEAGEEFKRASGRDRPGAYRLRTIENRFAPGRKVILALGSDAAGAWPAAALLAYSIHPNRDRLTALTPWPVQLPAGTYWSPFAADCAGNDDVVTRPAPAAAFALPHVPFGVRIWGSPMPTLGSYQRLIHALRDLGVDTVAVQSGGWPDMPDAAQRYRQAVEIAAHEGVATILYVGNDLVSHRPAPLTENHRAAVLATKDLPGLLEFHVYNQLAADLNPAERAMVEEQVRWLRGLTPKRIGMEIVWGHDSAAIPADKARLIADVKSWGVDVIANDDAPIGGWSRKHQVAIWEPRLRELARFGLPTEAVLQAHVPFVEPTIPSAAQLRSQFWWAVAGGARGFLIEAAYIFTSLSNRGLLSWDLRPLPDGRADEVRRLAEIAHAIAPFTSDAVPVSEADAGRWGLTLAPGSAAILRCFQSPAGRKFALVLNTSTERSAEVTILQHNSADRLAELAPGRTLRAASPTSSRVNLAPGDGACLEFFPTPP